MAKGSAGAAPASGARSAVVAAPAAKVPTTGQPVAAPVPASGTQPGTLRSGVPTQVDPFQGMQQSLKGLEQLLPALLKCMLGKGDQNKGKDDDKKKAAGGAGGGGSGGGGPGGGGPGGGGPKPASARGPAGPATPDGPGVGQDILNMADTICKAKDTKPAATQPGMNGTQASVPDGSATAQRPVIPASLTGQTGENPRKKNFSGNPQEFIEAWAPVALALQKIRGFPASVMLAQWGVETGWGTSTNYREGNSLAGHSCFDDRPTKEFPFQAGGQVMKVTGYCNRWRPANEGYKYLSFSQPEDSAVAHMYNLMDDPATRGAYPLIRRVMENVKPGEVANRHKILAGLHRYATAGNYVVTLTKVITTNSLAKYDQMGCENSEPVVAQIFPSTKPIYTFLLALLPSAHADDCSPTERRLVRSSESKIYRCERLVIGSSTKLISLKNYERGIADRAGVTVEVYDLVNGRTKLQNIMTGLGEALIPIENGGVKIHSLFEPNRQGDRVRLTFQTFVPPQVGSVHQIDITKDRMEEMGLGGPAAAHLDGRVRVKNGQIQVPISAQESKTLSTVFSKENPEKPKRDIAREKPRR